MAVVEGAENPRLGGVDVDALDAVRPRGEELLDLQTKRLRQAKKRKKHLRKYGGTTETKKEVVGFMLLLFIIFWKESAERATATYKLVNNTEVD